MCAAGDVCDRTSGRCVPRDAGGVEVTDVSADLAIAVGDDAMVHVAARSIQPAGLAAGAFDPQTGALALAIVVEGEQAGAGVDLALAAGRPRVSFRDGGAVKLASFNGTNWEVETIRTTVAPASGSGAERTAIAVDATGAEVVAFGDPEGGALQIAARSGRGWRVATADAGPDGGVDVAMAMAGMRPVVVHRRADTGQVRIVTPAEADWVSAPLGDPERGDAVWGRFASAAATPSGNVAVAFQDVTAGVLRVAVNDRGDLSIEVADDGTRAGEEGPARIVGAFASLSFGPDLQPAVAYQDGAAAALMLATRDAEGRWSRRILDATPIAGHGVALAFLPSGEPIVVHRRLALHEAGRRTGALVRVAP